MREKSPHIVLRLDTREPIEIGAFVGAFTSLAAEYEKYISSTRPDLRDDSQIYVREIRTGSIEADLIPWFTQVAPFIASMEQITVVEQFVTRWATRLKALIDGSAEFIPQSKSELATWSDAVEAIASDPDGNATLEAAYFEDGKKQIKSAFKFDTKQARSARRQISKFRDEMEKIESADKQRVLMVFTRTDINKAKVGKKSGERVRIEEISDKSLALMYGSAMAEQEIKHLIREADENVYKKGFVVDVNIRLANNKPSAYSVTHLHSVIDLNDD